MADKISDVARLEAVQAAVGPEWVSVISDDGYIMVQQLVGRKWGFCLTPEFTDDVAITVARDTARELERDDP